MTQELGTSFGALRFYSVIHFSYQTLKNTAKNKL